MPPSLETLNMNKVEDLTNDDQKERIMQLRKLLKDDDNLKSLQSDDKYLQRFLYSTNFIVEPAYYKMKTYYDTLLEFPEWYKQDSPLQHKSLIEKDIRIMTDKFDKEGRRVYIVKIGNTNVSSMRLEDVIAVDDIWLESILDLSSSKNGLTIIIDIAGFSLKMMKWLTPHNLKVGIKKLESMPFKDFMFHVVNSSFFINVAIKFVWPFLPESIKKMVKFHFDDWEALHTYIDPAELPIEYGGKLNYKFQEFYDKLYEDNDKIAESLKTYRTIEKIM